MAKRFGDNLIMSGYAIIGALLDPLSSDPTGLGSGQAGRVWYRTDTGKLMYWNGTAAIDLLNRANLTGTETASVISDLATVVQGYSLSAFAAPTGDLSVGSHKLTNVTDPGSNQDAATKNYVDAALSALASGQTPKGAVKCAATANVSLSTPGATIDGVTMVSGDVVLLTAQTTGSQGGPYVWTGASTALTRATNWDTSGEAVLGSYWIVEQGSNADTFALLSNDTALTLGTTTPAFVFRGAAGATYSVNGGLTLSGTAISVNPGTGILAAAGSSTTTAIDTSLVARKVVGILPTTTTGIFTVSGANVTVNHALSNLYPQVTVRAGSSPVAINGYTPTTGEEIVLGSYASDANNVVIPLPAAPATNAYTFAVEA